MGKFNSTQCRVDNLPIAFKAGFCFGAASAADAAAPDPEGELIEALVPAAGDGEAPEALAGSDMPGAKTWAIKKWETWTRSFAAKNFGTFGEGLGGRGGELVMVCDALPGHHCDWLSKVKFHSSAGESMCGLLTQQIPFPTSNIFRVYEVDKT